MSMSINAMQPTGEFSVPGTRYPVTSDTIRAAVMELSLHERSQVETYLAGGAEPSDSAKQSLRHAVVEMAEERRKRTFPAGKIRS